MPNLPINIGPKSVPSSTGMPKPALTHFGAKTREDGKVSIGQVIAAKDAAQKQRGVSVNALSQSKEERNVSTTQAAAPKHSLFEDAGDEQRADDRRYRHIRQLIKDRQTKEAEDNKKTGS